MKVLITGGAGFIGSNLADRLLTRGDEVWIIDNLETGQRRNVPQGAQLMVADIAAERLHEFFPTVDVVVHAAASYKNPARWMHDARTNVEGTARVIGCSMMVEAKRIIYLQTALCYGLKPLEQPITLEHPLMPWGSSYAITKTAAENFIRTSGMDFVSFRLANCYGPRNLSGPVPTFWKRLKEGQPCKVMDTRRDFVFVDDLVDVLVKAVDGKGHGFYHVSSGRDVRVADLYYAVCEALHLDRPVPVTPRTKDDVETILLDPAQTEKTFRWHTKTALADGIRKAIDYYNEFGVAETYTHLRLDDAEKDRGKT